MEKFIKFSDGSTGFVTYSKVNCINGTEHQWFGDGLVMFYNHKPMSERKYNLLSPAMKEELSVQSIQSTCNKCGIGSMEAENPWYM